MHGEGGEELVPAEPGSLAPPPGPVPVRPWNPGKVSEPLSLSLWRAFGEAVSPPAVKPRPCPVCWSHHAQCPGTRRAPSTGTLPSSSPRARRYPDNAGRGGGGHCCRQVLPPQSRTNAQPQNPWAPPPVVLGARLRTA